MPPRKSKPKDLLVLIVDVGSNVRDFDKVKQCAFNIYKGKLFKDKCLDEVALIVISTEESENPEGFDHISVALTPSVATWNNLKAINNLQQSGSTGDWLQGIKVACNLLEENSVGQSYAKVGFLIMSNFESKVNASLFTSVQLTLVQHSVDVICIGVEELTKSLQEEHPSSYETLEKLSSLSNVELCSLDQTLEETQFVPKGTKNPMPWNVDFCIGDISLPITGYKFVGKDFAPSIWQKTNAMEKGKEQHVCTQRIYSLKSEPRTSVEVEELVRGYHYGNTIVPMTAEEKAAMKYESGERGLKLICVTKKSNVPLTRLEDDTVYLITTSTKSQDNFLLLSLINQLHQSDEVAIARQVYSKNANPNVTVMYPVVEEDGESCKYYFVMAHLPFAQQIYNIKVPKVMEFNTYMSKLSEDAYQSEQSAMDAFLDGLDLTKGAEYAEDIPYLPEVTRDPSVQARATFLIQKYLSPHRNIVGAEIPSYIRQLYEPSRHVHELGIRLKQHLGDMLNTKRIDTEVDKSENVDIKEETD